MKKRDANISELQTLSEYALVPEEVIDAQLFKFARGEIFVRCSEPMDYIYFTISGRAKVFLDSANGRQLLLSYFVSDGVIGDLELMTGQRNASTTLQAVTEFVCIGLPLETNAARLKQNISFVNHVGNCLANKLLQCSTNSFVNTLHPLEERLCAYIAMTADDGIFNETLTEVASLLGVSYRHLLRCLNKLCENGKLERLPKGFRIVDSVTMSKLASLYYEY